MKKIILTISMSFILIIVSLSGCSAVSSVEKKLIGEWVSTNSGAGYCNFYDDNTFDMYTKASGESWNGKYSIANDKITLVFGSNMQYTRVFNFEISGNNTLIMERCPDMDGDSCVYIVNHTKFTNSLSPSNPLIGEWLLQSEWYNDVRYVFLEDGNLIVEYGDDKHYSEYTITGDKVRLSEVGSDDREAFHFKIEGNTLTLFQDEFVDWEENSIELEKINK